MKRTVFRFALAWGAIAYTLPAAMAQTADFRLGSAIAASQAERSVTVTPDTRWVNVHQGESVRFVAGQAEFGWKFDGTLSAIDLMRIAPAGMRTQPLTVFVTSSSSGRRGN